MIWHRYAALFARISPIRAARAGRRERDEQIHVLESLCLRLTNIPINVVDMALLLSVAEIAALDHALAGFCAFVREKVSPSRERDETLQDVERLRLALAAMLMPR
jgi:hypothetical protein